MINSKRNSTHSNRAGSPDRYLITYADLLTLLFALFVLFYVMSKPDGTKMQELMEAFNNAFNPNQMIEGNRLSPSVESAETPPLVLFPAKPLDIEQVQQEISTKLAQLVESKQLNLEIIEDGLKLQIPNQFLFPPAKATLSNNSDDIMNTIAGAIGDLDLQINIDGHTDNVPIKTISYPSNWELSAARAVTILQALLTRGVPPHNIVARAFADQRPITDNLTEEGREKNRRVEIIITQKDLSAAASNSEENENE